MRSMAFDGGSGIGLGRYEADVLEKSLGWSGLALRIWFERVVGVSGGCGGGVTEGVVALI